MVYALSLELYNSSFRDQNSGVRLSNCRFGLTFKGLGFRVTADRFCDLWFSNEDSRLQYFLLDIQFVHMYGAKVVDGSTRRTQNGSFCNYSEVEMGSQYNMAGR